MAELKPCPFCGAKVKIEPLYDAKGSITAIYCTNDPECGAMVTFVGNESKKKAVAAWNRRPAPENPRRKSGTESAENGHAPVSKGGGNKPLTLEQLRQMDGEPVWIANAKIYGILSVERDGLFVYGEYSSGIQYCWSVKKRRLNLYARRPDKEDAL